MTLAERNEAILQAHAKVTKDATKSRKAARALLIEEGIYTKDGVLSANYGGPSRVKKRKGAA